MLEELNIAIKARNKAQASLSNKKIGVCLRAYSVKEGVCKYFTGCNIEISTSLVFHAERVVLIKAISEGYTFPVEIHLIANNDDSCMPLCGYCRQDYMYLNDNLKITVYHPNGEPKYQHLKLIELIKYPYIGKSKIIDAL